jgi:hypothetical protein
MITKSDISLYHELKETRLTDLCGEINVNYLKKETFFYGDNYEF